MADDAHGSPGTGQRADADDALLGADRANDESLLSYGGDDEAAAAATAAMLEDEDALLQAALQASLAEHEQEPRNRAKASEGAARAPQLSSAAGSASSSGQQRKEHSSGSRAHSSAHARTKKPRSSNHPEAGPSTPAAAPSASTSHGSPRRRHRGVHHHDTETSASARLPGWNDSSIRMNAQSSRPTSTADSQGPAAASTSSRNQGNPFAAGASSMRSRTQSSMSIDADAAPLARHNHNSTYSYADEDAELEALISGPSGARARRRSRAQSGAGPRSFGSTSDSGGPGTPILIGSASGSNVGAGRRSVEHRSPARGPSSRPGAAQSSIGDDSIEFLGARSAPAARGFGGGRSVDNDIEMLPESYGSGSARRSPFMHPALRSANLDDIPQDEDDDEVQLGEPLNARRRGEEDDDEEEFEITGARRAPRSRVGDDLFNALMQQGRAGGSRPAQDPMLEFASRFGRAGGGANSNPAAALNQTLGMQADLRDLDGDLDEDFDDDGDPAAAALAHMQAMQSYLAAGGTAQAGRNYDDEDEALQAALAASLADAEGGLPELAHSTASLPEGYDPAAFDAQADAAARIAAMRSPTPPPQDVERIARMRREARQKEQEEREREERRARGEAVPSPPPAASSKEDKAGGSDNDDDDDDDEEDEAEAEQAQEVSAEEMRRRRLARFNA